MDNGTPFVAALDVLAAKYHIHHIRISPYNSQANGIVKQQHFPVQESTMKTCEGVENHWPRVMNAVFWAERVTISKATGYSPFYMVHGVEPLLPFDITEATYLLPPLDLPASTSDLIAHRALQLLKRPQDLADIHTKIHEARL